MEKQGCTFKVDELELVSFLRGGRGALEEQVDVDWDPTRFAMKESSELRMKIIEKRWSEATAAQPRLWNQSKYRLAGSLTSEGRPQLKVGLTDYKDHMGTNLSAEVDKWVGTGEQRWDYMSQCIGVGCWLVSSDQKVVLVETASWKGEQGCKVDRPGGHAEPEESLKLLPETERKVENITDELVGKELFECIQKEVRDEINVPLDMQSKPELLGVVINTDKGGRLGLEFLIKVEASSAEIKELYSQGGPEADESTNIFFVSVSDVSKSQLDANLKNRSEFCIDRLSTIRQFFQFSRKIQTKKQQDQVNNANSAFMFMINL